MKKYNRETVEMSNGILSVNNSYEGESIETKVRRITENKEPITDGAPIIYTDRKEGTKAEYNIRTDRFDVALDAMDYVNRTRTAKRMEIVKNESSKDEPKQATDGNEIA